MEKIIFFGIFNLFCALGTLSDNGMADEYEPILHDNVKSEWNLAVGDPLILFCSITNLGNYTLSWMKDGKVIAMGKDSVSPDRIETTYFPKTDQYRLVIQNLRWEDAGNYTCEINTNPPREDLFTLTLGDPKFVTTNQTFRVTRGETFVLPCEIKDLGDWVPYWTKYDFGYGFPRWEIYKEASSEHRPLTFRLGLDPKSYKFVNGYNLEIKNVTDDFSGVWVCGFEESHKEVRHSLEVVDNSMI